MGEYEREIQRDPLPDERVRGEGRHLFRVLPLGRGPRGQLLDASRLGEVGEGGRGRRRMRRVVLVRVGRRRRGRAEAGRVHRRPRRRSGRRQREPELLLPRLPVELRCHRVTGWESASRAERIGTYTFCN